MQYCLHTVKANNIVRSNCQIFQSAWVHCLHGRKPPAKTLGVFMSRCQYLWLVELNWDKSEGVWKLNSCRVAPSFTPAGTRIQPNGVLLRRHEWNVMLQDLQLCSSVVGLSKLVLWANDDTAAPPAGFRILSAYSDKLASIHQLPKTTLQLKYEERSTADDITEARIVGQGHRSLVIRVTHSADEVVKIGSKSSIKQEVLIHAHVDRRECQYLRPAKAGHHGEVTGAGTGLHFLTLKHYCSGSISFSDVRDPEKARKWMEQVMVCLNPLKGHKFRCDPLC
jgi:hypothetical protein